MILSYKAYLEVLKTPKCLRMPRIGEKDERRMRSASNFNANFLKTSNTHPLHSCEQPEHGCEHENKQKASSRLAHLLIIPGKRKAPNLSAFQDGISEDNDSIGRSSEVSFVWFGLVWLLFFPKWTQRIYVKLVRYHTQLF